MRNLLARAPRCDSFSLVFLAFVCFLGALAASAQQPDDLNTLDVPTLQKRADSGDAAAQAELGDRYSSHQKGVPHDPRMAMAWITVAANQGNARGEYLLGMMYRDSRSEAWYRAAADQGYLLAEVALAQMLMNGQDACQDLVQAATYYRKAAEQGGAGAQTAISAAYEFGLGVPRDIEQARIWYLKLTDRDNARSRLKLKILLSTPSQLAPAVAAPSQPAQDCVRGEAATRVLATLGDPEAAEKLGRALEERGDYQQAMFWDQRASDYWGTGGMTADYALLRIAVRLYNPNQLEAPDKIAARYLASAQATSSSSQNDFRTMSAVQVLKLLQSADNVKADLKGTSFPKHDRQDSDWAKLCNGRKAKDADENACFQTFTHYARDAFSDEFNPADLNYVMNALVRGCGLYAPSDDKANRGRTCGLLGRTLYGIGNIEAAKAVWELAPGCYSQDERTGTPLNGCVRTMTGEFGNLFQNTSLRSYSSVIEVFRGELPRLVRLMWESCNTVHDRESCSFLQNSGANVNMAAVEQAENERHEALQEYRADARARDEQDQANAEARRNAIFNTLASMGGSNPNAIVDAGNRQADAMRGIGNANAAAQQQAAQTRVASQQAAAQQEKDAQLVAKQQPSVVPSQQTSQVTQSSAASSSVSGTSDTSSFANLQTQSAGSTQYVAALPSGCIGQFWDPKYYNWLSFQNNCGQAIYLNWIAASPNDTFGMSGADLAPGASVNSGWNQAEVARKSGFLFFVCPGGSHAVNVSTNIAVSRRDERFACKQQ